MLQDLDCVVIGAGVIGLAVARALSLRGRDVVVLEAESSIGTGISSRSSEVIHAGLYYPPGSLKAQLCVRGRHALYDYCRQRAIAHRPCGKLIVATTPAQLDQLEKIRQTAHANGVTDLRPLTQAEIHAMEPSLQCMAALFSPATGLIDSHALMLSLQADAERHGATVVCRAPLQRARVTASGIVLQVQESRWRARHVVNCAGLSAPAVAAAIDGLPSDQVPKAYFAKGNYFSCQVRVPFSRLIYPIPEQAGLGVHLTLDLAGRARFGPDVEWVDAPHYVVDRQRAQDFYAEIRKYWPGLPADALLPDYAGVRPKLAGAGSAAQDFRIDDARVHGVAGLINMFGIESPGLTASLALADYVAGRLD